MKNILVGLSILSSSIAALNVSAQAQCPSPITFTDDFEDGDAFDWSPQTASRWQVSSDGGSLRYFLNTTDYEPTGAGVGELSLIRGRRWADFKFECSAKSADAIGGVGAADLCIIFGYQNSGSYYYINFNGSQGLTQLIRVHDGGTTVLDTHSPPTFADANYHSLRVERTGSQIRAFFDGGQILSANDSFFGEGQIGVGSFNDSGYFDDVSVTGCPALAELVADRIYLRTGPGSGAEVANPVAGQQYYIHFDWRNTGAAVANNFRLEIKLNGNVVCGYTTTGNPQSSTQQAWCTSPVIWPAGNNTIQGVLDVNNAVVELDENNNAISQTLGPFVDISAGLAGVNNSSVTWADFINNDGKLDVLLIGQDDTREVTKLYKNEGSLFTDISGEAALIGVKDGSAAWGDYDNDEDVDLLLTGDATSSGFPRITRIYRYESLGRFTLINAGLPGVRNGAGIWGDYDNDGDLDILLTGSLAPGVNITKIYKNDNGSFSEAVNLPGVAGGSTAAWGDYDNDGDLDILLTGQESTGNPVAIVYRNTNGSFENIGAPLTGVSASAVAWGDYDSDGDLDILLAGRTSNGSRITKIYQNNNNSFTDINAALPGIESGSVAWGDYDNDGDLDILLSGDSNAGPIAKVYRNNNGNFSEADAVLTGVKSSSAAWGDYDNDGDLDILLAGLTQSNSRLSIVYRSGTGTANTLPNAPVLLAPMFSGGATTVRWNKSTDTQTGQNALTYNVRLGTTPGKVDIVSPMSNLANGFRRVPKIGNAGHPNSFMIKNLSPGTTYYWSVQAVDNAFAGSAFATEQSFTVPPNRAPVVANAIPNQSLSVGTAFTRDLNSPAVFTDPDGDVMTYSASSSATNIATASVSGSTLTVTAAGGGSATITVTANDGRGGTVSTTFTVTVTTNRAPAVANAIPNQLLNVGGAAFTRDLTSPPVFTDADGDPLTYTASSSAPNIATASLSGNTLTVSPVAGGSATITITAEDGRGGKGTTTFMVTVNRSPAVANAIGNQIIMLGGPPFTRNLNLAPVVFNDPDGDALSYTASSSATNIATASISGSTLTVAPVAAGMVTITVAANDGRGGMASTTFTVTVNRPPVVVNQIPNQTITLGAGSFTRNLSLVFADPDGDALAYAASSSAPNIATASVSGTTLTVAPVESGIAIITVSANDGRGGAVSMTFSVTVNRRPIVANAILNQTLTVGGNPFTRNLDASPEVFNDPDGDALTYTASSSATNIATASIAGSTLTVSSVAAGNATISITADDKNGGMASTTFTVTVTMVTNRQPTVVNTIPSQSLTVGGMPFTRDLNTAPVIFSDPDGDALTYTASSSATNIATASIAGSLLTVSPVAAGNSTITVTANDNKGGTASTMFTVTVTGNRAPVVANAIPNQSLTAGGSAFTRDLNASPAVFTDLDGDALTYTASSSATNIAAASVAGSMLTVTPTAVGTAMITVTANDGKSGTVSTTFMVTVGTAPNRAPTVANMIPNQTLTAGGTSFTRDLNAPPPIFSDPDGDALTYTASSSATNIATATLSGSAIIVAPVAAGNATITVTANDGKGGSVSTTFGVTVNAANRPPTITHSPVSMQPAGQAISITANVADDRGIDNVRLNYRRGGETNFTPLPMTFVSGNYQANIPGPAVTSRGADYFIVAADVDGAQGQKPDTPGSFYSVQIQVTSEAKPTAQPSGSAATAYRLISVPLQLDNTSANAVLEDDLGSYDDTKWRLYGLTTTTSENLSNKEPYTELRTGGDLSPGKSLFLIVRDPGKTITSGAAKSVKTDQEFQITLQRGHNFVGTPFNFTIPASKLRLQSGGAVTLRTFNGSFTPATEMQPWEGYYIANLNQASDILFVNPNLSASAISKATGSGPTPLSGWRLRILASCGEARDDYNFAGAAVESHDGYDDADLAEPPPIGEYVSVYFPHPEWATPVGQKPLSRFSDDMRSASNLNQKWRFVVESNITNELVTLRFDGLKEIDATSAVFLVDEALQYKQNLRENAVYQYQPRRRDSAKEFTLIVGKENFIAEQTANAQGAPDDFVLEQNFPNPFNPETAIRFGLPQQSVVTIKIFDLAGHEVATLLDRVALTAGRHQRVWDGRDALGRAVVSGIYFCRLTAAGFAKTVKLTVMR